MVGPVHVDKDLKVVVHFRGNTTVFSPMVDTLFSYFLNLAIKTNYY